MLVGRGEEWSDLMGCEEGRGGKGGGMMGGIRGMEGYLEFEGGFLGMGKKG